MKLNEHQSKRLFAAFDLPVPTGELVSPADARTFRPCSGFPVMLKAQVLAGGRGKAGGILPAENEKELANGLAELFATTIGGERVPLVRVEPRLDISREMYLSLAVQRSTGRVLLTAGLSGGVDVETQEPESLLIQEIDPCLGLQSHQTRAAFFHLQCDDRGLWDGFCSLVENLSRCFVRSGLLLAEINPLALSGRQEWIALDAKVEMDDNLLDLRPDLSGFLQPEHATGPERRARETGLSYHSLSGMVGLVANGAGLAMATMDLLHDAGMPAANFLDLGGGADKKRMKTALELLCEDNRVRVVLVNIFGGILSCRLVAEAFQEALVGQPPPKPFVIRFSGNGAEDGLRLLNRLAFKNVQLFQDLTKAVGEVARQLGLPRPAEGAGLKAVPALDRKFFPDRPGPRTKVLKALGEGTVLVQGMTGREGRLHTRLMLEYGTRVVAGVTPFKEGVLVEGVPVYHSVERALRCHRPCASVIFVPALHAADAVLEAVSAGIPWVVCITEGIPQQDMLRILPVVRGSGSRLVGPNTPGLLLPGEGVKLGIMPGIIFSPGPVAVLSRSGTLTYECVARLSKAGIGQSLCLGIGGDPFVGSSFVDLMPLLEQDEQTRAVLVLGEIGGQAEEQLANWVKATDFSKPVVAFIAGRTAPPGKRLGHAGAILDPDQGGIDSKLQAMRKAGFTVCTSLGDIPARIAAALTG